jgi:hypothetical protein
MGTPSDYTKVFADVQGAEAEWIRATRRRCVIGRWHPFGRVQHGRVAVAGA